MVMSHANRKIKVKGQLVHNIDWKQMDRRTQSIALSYSLTRSVNSDCGKQLLPTTLVVKWYR